MTAVDLSPSRRIPIQLKLLTACTRTDNPAIVLQMFIEAMQHLYGQRAYVLVHLCPAVPGAYSIGLFLNSGGTLQIRAPDPFSDENLPQYRGGLVGGLLETPEPKLLHWLSMTDEPAFGGALVDYHSLMAVPMFAEGVPQDFLIVLDKDVEAFNLPDLEELNLRANLIGALLTNMRTARKLQQAQERIDREVDRVARIQRALLPQPMPHIAGAKVAAAYETFDRAGGDLYDLCPVSPDLWAILIADAAGHGPSATVQAAMLYALIRANLPGSSGPAELLARANRQLCQRRIGDSFVTAFLGFFDVRHRRLLYASAGHHPPLLKRRGSALPKRLDETSGYPLGIEPDGTYAQAQINLAPWQTLLLYTDGISETYNDRGEMFGLGGIERALAHCDGDPQCVLETLGLALREHGGSTAPADDRTMLAIQLVDS